MEWIGWDALDTETLDAEKSAGLYFINFLVNTCRDVELIKVFPSEAAGGGFQTREPNMVELFAVCRVVADNTGTMAERDPQVIIAIDGHTIRRGIDMTCGKGGAHLTEFARGR